MSLRALLAVALLTACSVDRRSESYTCDTETDCGAGRTCDEGWCVEVGGGGDGDGGELPVVDADPNAPDADPDAPDAAFICPPTCSSCNIDNVCIMACAADASCPTQVVCPPGVSCKVECEGANSCAAGVDCSDASSCRIECTGVDSCAQRIVCGQGQCIVECNANGSCAAGTDCSESCSCLTNCVATACEGPSECTDPGSPCTDNDDDCGGIENGNCNSC